MLITYRRTGGLFALLTLATVALAATVLSIAVAVTLAMAIAAAALVKRAVLPRSWRNRTVPSATPWPHKTIDAAVVNATSSSETRNLPRMGRNSR
jgi:MFS superfamily sulfate permease-like transporter